MKKVISIALVVVMLLSLCGCDLGASRMEELCGTWELVAYMDAEDVEDILEYLEFYPEEIALADLEALGIVSIVEFNEDKTYRFGYDVEATKLLVWDYFNNLLNTLYENREDLVDTYGDSILSMSKDEFMTAYAELFGMDTVEELLDAFTEEALDYDYMSEDLEVGTFRLRLTDMLMKIAGQTEEEILGFTVEGDTLTLIYVDGEEVYTRR